ncbi:MAG TPA: hypothetical protein VIK91_08280 [Nannocystis sp.]
MVDEPDGVLERKATVAALRSDGADPDDVRVRREKVLENFFLRSPLGDFEGGEEVGDPLGEVAQFGARGDQCLERLARIARRALPQGVSARHRLLQRPPGGAEVRDDIQGGHAPKHRDVPDRRLHG